MVQLPRLGIERRKRPAGTERRRRRIEPMRTRCCIEIMVSFATIGLDCIHFQASGTTEIIEYDPIVVGHLLLVALKSRQERRDSFDDLPPIGIGLSLIHISEPTRLGMISYAVFCLKKKKNNRTNL